MAHIVKLTNNVLRGRLRPPRGPSPESSQKIYRVLKVMAGIAEHNNLHPTERTHMR